jgi:peptidyl-prolyl cis-trans isomerase SurA
MPLVKIRMTLKDDLIKKMKSDKLRRKKFSSQVKVTDKEVRDFYREYGDSLPPASKEYEMYHIYLNRKLTESEKMLAKEKALIILDSIKNGADFSELAKRNSDDAGSAVNGGDLGIARKGVFVKEFEETLFRLDIDEVSDVVETEFGYHIIKLNEKKGDQRKGQHILVSFRKLESSDFETIALLNSIRDSISSGMLSFEDAAKKYSQEQQTAAKGGYMGLVPEEKLDSNYIENLSKLGLNEISKPLRVGDDKDYGYEIIKIKSISEPHRLTIENDYDRIKKFTIILKENKMYEDWVEELKKSIYVDVKL